MRNVPKAVRGGMILLALLVSVLLSGSLDRDGTDRSGRVGPGGGEGLLVAISRRPALALGFRNLLADLVWLEAVQVAGARRLAAAEYDRIFVLLNATADFDPNFEVPYILGGLVLGESPSHAPEALRILERGWRQRPGNWLFPFYVGYTRYFSLGDPVEGGRAMAEAAKLPGSPEYLPRLASRMLAEGRDPEAALAFLVTVEAQETDDARREILRRRIREVAVERDVQALEQAVGEYRARFGPLPPSLSALVRAGLLPAIPEEPHGGSYLLGPDGTVKSDRVARRLRVFVR